MPGIAFALSISHFVNSVGAAAGFASVIGLAVLVLLYFTHARETSNLRERAAVLEARLQQLESRLVALARSTAQPPAPAPSAAPSRPGAPFPRPGFVAPAQVSGAPFSESSNGAAAQPALVPAAAVAMAGPALGSATRVVGLADPPAAPSGAGAAAPAVAPAAPPAPEAKPAQLGPRPSTAAAVALNDPPLEPAPAPGGPPVPVGPPEFDDELEDDRFEQPSAPPRGGGVPQARPARAGASRSAYPRGSGGGSGSGGGLGGSPGGFGTGGLSPAGRLVSGLLVAAAVVGVIVLLIVLTSGGGSSSSSSNAAGAGTTGTSGARTTNAPGAKHKTPGPVAPAAVKVVVLNGTSTSGLAHRVSAKLAGLGYKQGLPLTAPDQTHSSTIVAYLPGAKADAIAVASALKLGSSSVQPIDSPTQSVACPPPAACTAQVVVTVGADLAATA